MNYDSPNTIKLLMRHSDFRKSLTLIMFICGLYIYDILITVWYIESKIWITFLHEKKTYSKLSKYLKKYTQANIICVRKSVQLVILCDT